MKITKILPKFLAKSYQAEDLRRAEIQLQYYQGMVRVLKDRVSEGQSELDRLEGRTKWVSLFLWLELSLYWGSSQLFMLMEIYNQH